MPRKARETPHIKRRPGTETYYVFWYDAETGREERKSLRTTDEGEAHRKFAHLLLEDDSIFRPRGPGGLTVAQALDDYMKEHVYVNCAAAERQEFAIRNLKEYFGTEKEIASVDIPLSRKYAEARRAGQIGGDRWGHRKTASDSTVRRELNVLVAAANHARKWKRLVEMPSIELPFAQVIGYDDEAPYYTKEELRRLIDTAEGELKWFIELAYWTGARRRSIENLTRGQIDWNNQRILLQAPGKRRTNKRQPIVPIVAEMKSSLRALCDASAEDRLFRRVDFYSRFRAHCKEQGMGNRAKPHLLRHTRATHLLQDGVGIYHVAKLLGDTIDTVERVYGHHAADDLAVAIGR